MCEHCDFSLPVVEIVFCSRPIFFSFFHFSLRCNFPWSTFLPFARLDSRRSNSAVKWAVDGLSRPIYTNIYIYKIYIYTYKFYRTGYAHGQQSWWEMLWKYALAAAKGKGSWKWVKSEECDLLIYVIVCSSDIHTSRNAMENWQKVSDRILNVIFHSNARKTG